MKRTKVTYVFVSLRDGAQHEFSLSKKGAKYFEVEIERLGTMFDATPYYFHSGFPYLAIISEMIEPHGRSYIKLEDIVLMKYTAYREEEEPKEEPFCTCPGEEPSATVGYGCPIHGNASKSPWSR